MSEHVIAELVTFTIARCSCGWTERGESEEEATTLLAVHMAGARRQAQNWPELWTDADA